MKIINAAALASALLLAGAAQANEVVVTPGQAKSAGGGQLALDFVNSGQATAFEFEVAVPKGVNNVDTSRCLSELPPSHTGMCRFNAETKRVVVMVLSNENKPLPDGIVPLGRLSGTGAPLANAHVEKLLVSDTSGHALPVTAGQGAAQRPTPRAEHGKAENNSR